jgi:hypothetical protein
VPVPDEGGRLAGFDLDGHATTDYGDPIGCGQGDFPGLTPADGDGVDNEGALLIHDVAAYLPWFDAAAFNARIREGSMLFGVELGDVDSLVDDDHVTVTLYLVRTPDGGAPALDGDELAPGQTFAIDDRSLDGGSGETPRMYFPEASIENGRVVAGPSELPFVFVFPDGRAFSMTVHGARLRFDVSEDGVASGLVGGGLALDDLARGFDAADPLRRDLAAAVLRTRADLEPDESGHCTELSVGLVFDGMPAAITE